MDIRGDVTQDSAAIRVGDMERNACVVSLIGHHLQGRLTSDELEQRQRLASVAVDARDLSVLLADLPQEVVLPTPRVRPVLRVGDPGRALAAVRSSRWTRTLLVVAPVAAVGRVAESAWQNSSEAHYITAAVAGAVGYATHAVRTRKRSPRRD